jgi:hypothetical protein
VKYEYWDFLDEFNGNLLYNCAGNKSYTFADMNEVYYYIWFLYRYVLGCETLEEALQFANAKTMKELGIGKCFITKEHRKHVLVLGNEAFGTLVLCSHDVKKPVIFLKIVLEILYKRYNYLEQIECYIRHFWTAYSSKLSKYECKQPVAVREAKAILRKSLDYMEHHTGFEEMLQTYRETRKEILGECYYEI